MNSLINNLNYIQKIDKIDQFGLLVKISELQKELSQLDTIKNKCLLKYQECTEYLNTNPILSGREDDLQYLINLENEHTAILKKIAALKIRLDNELLALSKNKDHYKKIGDMKKKESIAFRNRLTAKESLHNLDRYLMS